MILHKYQKYISILDKIDSWLKAKDDKLASLIGFDPDKYGSKFTIDPDLAARLQNSNQCLGIRFYNEDKDEIATLTSWPCDKTKWQKDEFFRGLSVSGLKYWIGF